MITHVRYTVAGSGPLAVPFPYLDKSHVVVQVNGVVQGTSAYTWPTLSSIQLVAPVDGTTVDIFRQTPETSLTIFESGTTLTSEELEGDSLQALYRLQEVQSQVDLSLRYADGTTGKSNILPDPSPLAVLVWKNDLSGLANGDPNITGDLLLRGQLASTSDPTKGTAMVQHIPVGTSTIASSLRNALAQVNGVPVTLYATSTQLAIDATDAVVKAIADARALGKNAVYFPGGQTYRFAAASASIDPGTTDIVFYGDGWSSTLVFEEGTGVGDINTQRKSLFRNNTTTLKGSVEFRDLHIKGTWSDKGYAEGGGTVLFLDYYNEIVIQGCKFENLSWMATCCEAIRNVRVLGNTFDTICRDIVRFRSSFNVQVIGNRFAHNADDGVALHNSKSGVNIREGIVVSGNVFEDCGGVHVLGGRMVSINNNVFRRCKNYIIAVDSSAALIAESDNSMFGVSVVDNQIYDSLQLAPFTGPLSQVITLVSHPAEAGSDSGGIIPGRNNPATGGYQLPWLFRNGAYSSATQSVPDPFFYQVRGNTIARTLPSGSAYSAWGYGQVMTNSGFTDPVVPEASMRPGAGILLDGDLRKAIVSNNIVAHTANAIGFLTPTSGYSLDDVLVADNLLTNFSGAAVSIATPGTSLNVGLVVRGNLMDGDPYHNHSNRTSHGTWAADTLPTGLQATSATGVRFEDNRLRNVAKPVENGGSSNIILHRNALRCDPVATGFSVSNKGIGNCPNAGVQYDYEIVDSDPAGATYGALVSTMLQVSGAQPSAGKYVAGHFVQSVSGSSVLGWKRLTTGTAHVAGTDWKTVALT